MAVGPFGRQMQSDIPLSGGPGWVVLCTRGPLSCAQRRVRFRMAGARPGEGRTVAMPISSCNSARAITSRPERAGRTTACASMSKCAQGAFDVLCEQVCDRLVMSIVVVEDGDQGAGVQGGGKFVGFGDDMPPSGDGHITSASPTLLTASPRWRGARASWGARVACSQEGTSLPARAARPIVGRPRAGRSVRERRLLASSHRVAIQDPLYPDEVLACDGQLPAVQAAFVWLLAHAIAQVGEIVLHDLAPLGDGVAVQL